MSGHQPAPYGQGSGQSDGAYNLSGLGESLPEYLHHPGEAERSTSRSSATLHQQSPSPFAGQAPMTNPGYGTYPQYPTPFQQAAASAQAYSLSQMNQPHQGTGPSPIQSSYSGHNYYPNQHQQQYLLYPGQYGHAGQPHQALPAQYAQSFGRGSNPAFGIGASQQVPDIAGIPTRGSQYGGFSPSGPLSHGYGPGASFLRSGFAPGKLGSSTPLRIRANSTLSQIR